MILHLMYDEKVISRTIQYFEEALPGQNRFVIMIPFLGYQCKYVNIQSDKVFYVKYGSKFFWKYVGNVNQYSNVICHLLGMNAIRFVLKTRHPAVTWMVWGADIYSELLPARGFQLYDRESIEHIPAKNQRLSHKFKVWLKRRYKLSLQVRAGKCISNACIGVGDYQLLLQYYPEFQLLKRKPFFYYPIDSIIPESLKKRGIIGDNIMVGNSASLSGNHFRVFKLLSELDLNQRKVIVPVSYGEYKEQIIEEGQRLLGSHFVPLIDYLPLQEYNRILLQSQTFVYGHYRQEAWGNIVIALYIGATVFLESCNPLMVDIKALGCVVFSMDQLDEKLHYKLTEFEMKKNREIIERNFNHERLMQCIKETFGAS